MLSADHPNLAAYAKDASEFKRVLFQELRAAYSSLYTDHTEDVIAALNQLDLALHEGLSAEQLLEKMRQASNATEQQYRTSVSKLIRGQFWKRTFNKPIKIIAAKPAKPYEGPMPERP